MTPERIVALVLVAAVCLAALRLLGGVWRSAADTRPRLWRVLAILVLQAIAAGLLYLTLLPPPLPGAAGTLVVATAGATRADLDAAAGAHVVALPEAGALPGIATAPDLATALRRTPQARRVQVVGAGLEARDRDAVAGRALAFAPTVAPRGIVALDVPDAVAPGQRWRVRGRVTGVDGARLELRDPADRRVAVGAPDATGAFMLDATARIAGEALYSLQLRDGDDAVVERLPVPVRAVAQAAPRVLLVASTPNPDLKYLRRWADDAGLSVRQRIEFGGGARIADAGTAIDRATLADLDLVVFDAGAFGALGASQQAALREAVEAGLGVLVHAPGALPATVRSRLRALGLDVTAAATPQLLQLDPDSRDVATLRARLGAGSDDAPFDPALANEALPALAYRPLRGDAAAFAEQRGPADLARWRARGRGRIGVTGLEDSWQLVTAGRGDVHAELWSGWVGTLARAGDGVSVQVMGEARPGERVVLCLVALGDQVLGPDGSDAHLQLDPQAGAGACAAYWPRAAGWHRVVDGAGATARPFHVRSSDEGLALRDDAMRAATLALVRSTGAAPSADAGAAPTRRGSPWPWFAGWLVAVAALWALERARLGRAPRRARED